MLKMSNKVLDVAIVAEAGGGIAGFDWHGRREPVALMRRCDPALALQGSKTDPRQLSCFPLLPWSNRIAGSGFMLDGRWITLPPNCKGEPWPIHGTGWQSSWQVEAHTASSVHLSLRRETEAPYRYRATMYYALSDDALGVSLEVTNTGSTAMPFGLGLHPFFPRHDDVRLFAPAPRVWINDGQTPLPTRCIPTPAGWDFRAERALPRSGLDNAFEAWSGEATIRWPLMDLGLRITASVKGFVIYTPADRDFFCFEPVDHPINAVNLPGGAVTNGMTLLAPQATLRRDFSFGVLDRSRK